MLSTVSVPHGFIYLEVGVSVPLVGDPVSMDLDRQREWDEAVRLYFYNQETELLLHGELVGSCVYTLIISPKVLVQVVLVT